MPHRPRRRCTPVTATHLMATATPATLTATITATTAIITATHGIATRYFEASPLPAQRSNPRLIRRENRWERCQRERMLVRSRTIAAPLLVRHPTLPCAARHACTRHRMGTRQSRRFSSRRRLCCESANDNSPLPTAVVEFDLDQQRAFAIHLHLPR